MTTPRFFERYRLLGDANRQLAYTLTVDGVLEVLRAQAREITEADGVAVIKRDGDQVVYVGEDAIAPLWTGQRFPIERCITGLAILGCEPILLPDITRDARVPLNAFLATFVKSMAAFPLGMPAPRAALGLYWRDAKSMGRDVEALVGMLAQAANTAFERIAADAEHVDAA